MLWHMFLCKQEKKIILIVYKELELFINEGHFHCLRVTDSPEFAKYRSFFLAAATRQPSPISIKPKSNRKSEFISFLIANPRRSTMWLLAFTLCRSTNGKSAPNFPWTTVAFSFLGGSLFLMNLLVFRSVGNVSLTILIVSDDSSSLAYGLPHIYSNKRTADEKFVRRCILLKFTSLQ